MFPFQDDDNNDESPFPSGMRVLSLSIGPDGVQLDDGDKGMQALIEMLMGPPTNPEDEPLYQEAKAALEDDNIVPSDEVKALIGRLDDRLDQGLTCDCGRETCASNKLFQLRASQRERIGYVPEFRIVGVEMVFHPDQPVSEGYTRYTKAAGFPSWLIADMEANGAEPTDFEMIDILAVGPMPGEPPAEA